MLTFLLPLFGSKSATEDSATCLQCGQCCASFGGHLQASSQDLRRWHEAGRQDLLDRVNRLGWIWVDPQSKQLVTPCPHIDRSDQEHLRCAIYELRPDICRTYPTLAHGKHCLRGVFLHAWTWFCIQTLPDCAVALETLPLAA